MPKPQIVQSLNLIVASPGDVGPERDVMNKVVDKLNPILMSQFSLQLRLLRWETDVYPAFHLLGPQGQVDEGLQIDECDIMVGIFWKKFGSPVKDAKSGTEHELRRAYSAWKKSKGKRPQIMIYFKNKKFTCKDNNEKKQKALVDAYKKKLSAKALWWSFESELEFELLVQNHLLMYLLRNAGELGGRSYRVIKSHDELVASNKRIVNEAQDVLFTTGSRSRDEKYLKSIENRIRKVRRLTHYRVLFGEPHHTVLKKHLLNLLKLRDPEDRSLGYQTLHLGLFDDYASQFDTYLLGNESEVLVLLPSLLGVGQYDSGVVFTGQSEVEGLLRFVKDLYGRSAKVETVAAINQLQALDGGIAPRRRK